MTILCLTGWQQPYDALANIAPDAVHFDYSAYTDVNAMFAALPREPKLAIGWSLGGQLLAHAIAAGVTKPAHLVLLGAPFQWVEGEGIAKGVSKEMAAGARKTYLQEPEAMLRNLNGVIALGDKNEKQIIRALNATLALWKNGAYWLDELTRGSCSTLDFSGFPPTTIVHGVNDKVIHSVNAQAYGKVLPQSELWLWTQCAHAPHLHDAQAISELIAPHV